MQKTEMPDLLNSCDGTVYSTTEENYCDYNEYSQKYIYKFDDPLVQENAYVQVINNRIIVQFPLKHDHTQSFSPMHYVQLYLNKQIVFYSDWLPILTLHDQTKFKTMFQQLWHEYTMLTHFKHFTPIPFAPFMHCEVVTTFNQPSYYLKCYENSTLTSIEIETKKTKSTQPHSDLIQVQFYFGPHLVFCSATQLESLDADAYNFTLSYILQKMLN